MAWWSHRGCGLATKFYLPSNAAIPSVSPAISSGWTNSVNLKRFVPVTAKTNSANADFDYQDAGSNPSDQCRFQWVYGPISAVTITAAQTISVGVMGHHGSTWGFHWLTACVRVVKSDLTLRGTVSAVGDLYANNNSYPANDPYSSRYKEDAAPSSVVCSDGDYLCLEFGYHNESGSLMHTYFQLGDGNASDIDSTDSTTDRNPFFNFSSTTFTLMAPTNLTYDNDAQTLRPGDAMTSMSATVTPSAVQSSCTFAVTTGALPDGVTLDSSTGTISGTPTTSGSYSWKVTATNSGGSFESAAYTMSVRTVGGSISMNISI